MAWSTILVPHDFSASANHAAALARDQAKLTGARIVLLHVLDLHQVDPDAMVTPPDTGVPTNLRAYATSSAHAHLEDLAKRLTADGVVVTSVVRAGTPVDEILLAANDEAADLIVMGTHGHTGIRHLIAGSVTERIVRTASIPVLTVRHPDKT